MHPKSQITADIDANSTQLAAILADTGTTIPGLIAALNNLSSADIATALATYDGPTNAEMVAAFTEIKGATWSGTTDTLEAIRDRGDAAWITGNTTAPDNSGIAAIKAKTDNLTFTKANELDANVQSINDVTITGDGSATPFDV